MAFARYFVITFVILMMLLLLFTGMCLIQSLFQDDKDDESELTVLQFISKLFGGLTCISASIAAFLSLIDKITL